MLYTTTLEQVKPVRYALHLNNWAGVEKVYPVWDVLHHYTRADVARTWWFTHQHWAGDVWYRNNQAGGNYGMFYATELEQE